MSDHVTAVDEIFKAFGKQVTLANETGLSTQTVNSWVKGLNPEIPPWRRPAVLDAAHRLKLNLSPAALQYLSSDTRTRIAA